MPDDGAQHGRRMARTLGYGLKAGVAQFIKSRRDTGEEAFFGRQPGVQWQVLDELTYLLNYGYLDAQQVCSDLVARPAMQHVVITGRAAPQCLLEMADTVSELRDVKHAFRDGVRAQPGIDL